MRSRYYLTLALLLPFLLAADVEEDFVVSPDEDMSRRALELETREAALLVLEEDILAKLAQLEELRKLANASIEPQENRQKADIKTLIKFYQSMKPKAAAELLEKLPLPLASDVLGSMKSREAAKILNVMKSDRAVVISKRMAGNK